jgi:hypothetical protein
MSYQSRTINSNNFVREYVANRADERGVSQGPGVWVGPGNAYELNTLCDFTVSADLTQLCNLCNREARSVLRIHSRSLTVE